MKLTDKLLENEKIILSSILNVSEKYKGKLYIVGGVVRDLLMDNEIKDIDILVEGNAIEFAHDSGFKINSIHEPFNTAKIEILGKEVDIASTRIEKYDFMGALPTVTKTGVGIEDDLKRRDFTINSIAYNLHFDKIIDPYFGQDDIRNKNLKALHNNSFLDDPTRILRGLDFKHRFDFKFDNNSKKLINECVKTFNNEHLSIDRIYLTLNKIFSYSYSNKILADIIQQEIYKIWMKKTTLEPEQINRLDNSGKVFGVQEKNKLYIAALESFSYIKPPLKNNFEIYEFFKKFNNIQLALYYFKTNDENAIEFLKLSKVKPLINGNDLKEQGFKEGEFIGVILKDVLKQKLLFYEKFKTKEDELAYVLNNYSAD